MPTLKPNPRFDGEAEEAAPLHTSLFEDSPIDCMLRQAVAGLERAAMAR
ncbi:MAG: hypothetical protein PVF43_15120 [Candidatus Eiseniibacteriota bacterium]|jgi:predicted 3-demethylubiquinone-9 3-methyltransferase (glyoxalase superfamily)